MILSLIFLGYLVLMSVIAFTMYYIDKQKAKKNKWRTPEAALLFVGFIGGAAGALASMQTFRHKTKHIYFYIVNIFGLIWQIGVLGFLITKIFI